ncbi:MAG TPA: TetR/AcrR family transcriptional regulator [Devosia sp.]|jgi:TetR/AcrR family transcriptional repressor of nem operon|nr:TetR/AcrR family transcriptional regulator [Devosia sp.]
MRVSREKAAENRERVVAVAAEQFRAHGFDGIGVADLMKAAGLTHGGFYGQFASKDDLAAEAATRAFAETTASLRTRALATDDPFATAVSLYLSAAHRDSPDRGCAIAALSQDAARGSPKLRAAFEAGIGGYLELIEELSGGTREQATAIYATLVGGLTLARTVTDPALSDAILASTKAAALAMRNSASNPLRS